MNLALKSFLENCIENIGLTSKEQKVKKIIYFRYDVLGKMFPHKIFSVNECSLDFFKQSLDYITEKEELPDDKDLSEYSINYLNWIKLHKK